MKHYFLISIIALLSCGINPVDNNSRTDDGPIVGAVRYDDWMPNIWYTMAQPYQISNNLTYTLNWIATYPETAEANTMLIYAWNEFSEGGWICPTLDEGNALLQAINSVLNP